MQKEVNGTKNGCKTTRVFDKEQLKCRLTPLQYRVTQDKVTERPFSGEYVKLNDNGMYCCVVCGEEVFSSVCKFDSGCGWPAFSDVIQGKVKLRTDVSHVGGNLLLLALRKDAARTEVTCANCDAHLGHLFDDGPKPTGKRFCINSAALQFFRSNKSLNEMKPTESVNSKSPVIKSSHSVDCANGFDKQQSHNNGNSVNVNGTKTKCLLETHL